MCSPRNPYVYIHWILDFKYILLLSSVVKDAFQELQKRNVNLSDRKEKHVYIYILQRTEQGPIELDISTIEEYFINIII